MNTTVPPGKFHDICRLHLVVGKTGSRRFEQRYPYKGQRRTIGLEADPGLSLHEARAKALDNLRLVRSGIDPSIERSPGPLPAPVSRRRGGLPVDLVDSVRSSHFRLCPLTLAEIDRKGGPFGCTSETTH